MKVRRNKSCIVVTEILNESLLEDVKFAAERAKCTFKSEDYFTKMVIKGNASQLDKFVELYNKG